jgi:flagellar hook-associated protein 2
MDISALASALSSSAAGGASARLTDVDPGGEASRRQAKARPEPEQAENGEVLLSALAQVKSALAEVQTAATTLQESKLAQTADGAKNAAESFVKAYNAENRTSANLTRREDVRNSASALADVQDARTAPSELQRVVQSSEPELAQVGIALQKDGSLTIDTKAFEAAYAKDSGSLRQSLSAIGASVEPVVTRQLNASGSVGGASVGSGSKLATPENRQADAQARLDQSQQNAQAEIDLFKTGPFATGVSAYKGIFSI